jgi:hypothetical protein
MAWNFQDQLAAPAAAEFGQASAKISARFLKGHETTNCRNSAKCYLRTFSIHYK